MYNVMQDGNTYPRLELYVDKKVNNSDDDIEIKNEWELVTQLC